GLERGRSGLERARALDDQLPDGLSRLAGHRRVSVLEGEVERLTEPGEDVLLRAPVVRVTLPGQERRRVTGRDRPEPGILAPRRETDPAARLAYTRELAGDGAV